MKLLRHTVAGLLLAGSAYAWGALPTDAVSYISRGEPLFITVRTLEKTLETKIVLRDVNPEMIISGQYVAISGKSFVEEFARRNKLAWVYRDNQIIFAPAGTDLSVAPKANTKAPAPTSFSRVVLDPKDSTKNGLMIFQVQNALADDRKGANNKIIAGVGRLFSQFIGSPYVGNPTDGANNPNKPATVPPVPESAKVQNNILGLFSKNAPSTSSSGEPNLVGQDRGVYVDSRLNAILVRDKVAHFESYKQIIALLDRPADMVQLEAFIVDINKTQVSSLGINLGLGGNSTAQNLILNGFSSRALFSQLRAMEATGDVETLSVPSVVSLNNEQALFSSRENFFISVGANAPGSVSSVNQITAETQLLVTPIIANESADVPFNERRVKLLINVQDAQANAISSSGTKDNVTINTLPTTTENQITTQAVVRSGDTLVIGGQVIKKKSKNSAGLPALGRVPVLGALFAQKDEGVNDYVRVYIVRPQILGEDSKTANELTGGSENAQLAKKVVK